MVTLSDQYLNDDGKDYSVSGSMSFDKETWDKVKKAVDTVFANSK